MSELNETEDNGCQKEEVPVWFIASLIGEIVYLRTHNSKAWKGHSNTTGRQFIGWYLWQSIKEEIKEGSQHDLSSESSSEENTSSSEALSEYSEYSEASGTEDEVWYGGEEEIQDTSSDIP